LEILFRNKSVGDVFGSNWPYDNFSLIESLKIDISFAATPGSNG